MSGISLVLTTTRLDERDFTDLVERVFEFCVRISPVDTGYFQSQWEYTLEYPEAEVFNDVPYAEFLDEGWSSQAPDGVTGPAASYAESISQEY